MAITEPPAQAVGGKGLQAGALGLVGNMVIGLASVAPAYSLAATLKPDYGYTAFGSIGGVFVLGVGMLALGVPLMLACFAFGTKRFFRGETLNSTTEVKVPDNF